MKNIIFLVFLFSINFIKANENFVELSKNTFEKIKKIERLGKRLSINEQIDLGILKYYNGDIFEAEKIFLNIKKNKIAVKNDEIKILYFLSLIYSQIDLHEKSFNYLSDAKKLIIVNQISDLYLTQMIELQYSYFNYLYGNNRDAILSINKIIRNSKSDVLLANAYGVLGLIENIQNNIKKSTSYCKKAIEIFKKNGLNYYESKVLHNVIINLFMEKKYMKGLKLTNEYYNKAVFFQNKIFQGKAFLLFADFYFQLNNIKKGKYYLDKIEANNINTFNLRHYYQTKFDYLKLMNNKSEIEKLLNEAIENKNISNYMKINFIGYTEEFYINKNDFKKAYYFAKLKADFIVDFEEFTKKILNDNSLHAYELQALNVKLELAKKNSILKNVIIIAILLLLISIYFYHKSANERLQLKKLQAEKDNLLLENEIKMQNNKLIDFDIYLKEKNDFINEIKEIIDVNRKKSNTSELIAFLDFKIQENNKLVSDKMYENLDWLEFEKKLLHINNTINKKEIKIASLLKLNYTTKDIASQLNLSSGVIDNYRSSLRKKLHLEKSDNLISFLNSLS